jgi:hypothetical protein
MKLDLLTNATVVDDAIRFTKESQDRRIISKREQYNKESKGLDYSVPYELRQKFISTILKITYKVFKYI